MNDELTQKLNEKYPKIFHRERADGTKIPFYFECGDGWYNIIDSLCSIMQHKIDWNNAEGRFSKYQPKEPRKDQVVAHQVKEKFGGLRFYATGMDEEMLGALSMAEAISSRTCETCGNPALEQEQEMAWIITECGSCREVRNAKR